MPNPDVKGAREFAREWFKNPTMSVAELDGKCDDKPFSVEWISRVAGADRPKGGYVFTDTVAGNLENLARGAPLMHHFLRQVLKANHQKGIAQPEKWHDIIGEILSGEFVPPCKGPGRERFVNTFRNTVLGWLASDLIKGFNLHLHRNHSPSGQPQTSACDVIVEAYRNAGGNPPSAAALEKAISKQLIL